MLLQSDLLKSYWHEAVHTPCYLTNRCPSSAIGFKTPIQLWSDYAIDYSRLKVFVCVAYAHVEKL